MKALLVGGSGATGLPIAEGLARQGYEVTILHRGVHEPPELARFEHIHADPHFAEPVAAAIGARTFDAVVLTYGRLKDIAPLFAGRCDRLVAIGGMPIYPGYLDPAAETPPGMPIPSREDGPRADPALMPNPGAAKFALKMRAAEDVVLEQHARGAYAATLFRYPAIYGPRSMSLGDWSLIQRLRDKRPFVLLPNAGLGIISRCAAVNAAWCVLESLKRDAARGEVFNCADEEQFTLGQWFELICAAVGETTEFVPLPPQLNWSMAHWLPLGGSCADHGILDISKARDLLGYRDQVKPRDALAGTIAWRLAHPPSAQELQNWPDRFDYAAEDEIKAALDAMLDRLGPMAATPEVIHPYPHPKEPTLTADHRGR